MPNIMLNLTYGKIRDILKKEYHDHKSKRRALLGAQSGIQKFEDAIPIKKFPNATQVTFNDFAKYTELAYQIYSSNGKKIHREGKQKAHVRCSDELLTLFSTKFLPLYQKNHCQLIRQAFRNNDIDFIEKSARILTIFAYHQFHYIYDTYQETISPWGETPQPYRNMDAEICDELIKDSGDLTHVLLNLDVLSAALKIPGLGYRLSELIESIELDQASYLNQLLTRPDCIRLLDYFHDIASQHSEAKRLDISREQFYAPHFLRKIYIAALLINHDGILTWVKSKVASARDLEITDFPPKDIAILVKQCEITSLKKFLTPYVKYSTQTLVRPYDLNPDYRWNENLEKLFYESLLRDDIEIFSSLVDILTTRYGIIETTDKYNALIGTALCNAVKVNPFIVSDENGSRLLAKLHIRTLTITADLLDTALNLPNDAFFIWVATYGIDYNLFHTRSQKILTYISDKNEKIDLTPLRNSTFFTSLIGLALRKNGPLEDDELSAKKNLLKRILATDAHEKIYDYFKIKFFNDPEKKLERVNIQLIKWLINLLPLDKNALLNIGFFHGVFAETDQAGQAWILNRFPEFVTEFIENNYCASLKNATIHGSFEQFSWLLNQLKEEARQKALTTIKYSIKNIIRSAKNQIEALELLETYYPGGIIQLIKDDKNIFDALHADQQTIVTHWLLDETKHQTQAILNAHTGFTKHLFVTAADNGDLTTLMIIAKHCPDHLMKFIYQRSCLPFQLAMRNHHLETADWLLEDPLCLAFAESSPEYQGFHPIVLEHVQNHIVKLREQYQIHRDEHPESPFNLANKREAKHAFYMIRSLIRHQGNPDDIAFLLSIPSVRARAHKGFTGSFDENGLLRLARQRNNEAVCQFLLTIDEVRRLAAARHHYQNDRFNAGEGMDLRQLAANRESSMVELNEEERQALNRALRHYQPQLDKTTTPQLIEALQNDIIKHYEADPATFISENGKTIKLPLTHQEFQSLRLSKADHDKALEAYHKHQVHGAFRFLSRPNPWIHPDASFVYVNPDNPSERWASDRSDNLIALLYLGGLDKETPCIRGFTPQTKIEHLYLELALINRGHNWDHVKNGVEYDDTTEKDRPSCGPGMDRRLLYAMPGNPYFNILTRGLIRQEIGAFAFNYFNKQLTKDNLVPIFNALDQAVVDIDPTHITDLAPLNIPKEKQEKLKNKLIEFYGKDFSISLQRYFDSVFQLSTNSDDVFKQYHAITLSGMSNIYSHLETLKENLKAKPSGEGLFAPKKEKPTQPDNKSLGLRRGD